MIPEIKVFLQMEAFADPSAYSHESSRIDSLRIPTSCLFNVSNTRISILLASLYFGTARITLMATLFLVASSRASTTLPNVPWPRSFTILSAHKPGVHASPQGLLTFGANDIIWLHDIVPFVIVPWWMLLCGRCGCSRGRDVFLGRCRLGQLYRCCRLFR